MSEPRVDVLVINWNGLEHLEDCFSSLLASTYGNLRIVLVDNASDDDSVAFVRERFGGDPRVRVLVCPENLGWSGGNNRALELSLADGADYILLLNNDTATEPGAVERLVEMAEARPETGVLAPKMLLFHQPDLLNSLGLECSVIGASWDIGLGRLDGERWAESRRVAGACGGAMFLRAEAVRKAGLLPEDFEIYLDDLDLCLRVWNAGYEVRTCPDARVRHKFSATFGQGRRTRHKYFLNTRNRFYLMLRNFPWRKLPLAAPAVLLGEARAVGRALLDREPWRAWAHARAWRAALAYVPLALAERRRRARAGMGRCRFWQLVRGRPFFCPGYVLPEDGWYPPVRCGSQTLRPMAAHASATVTTGRLRAVHGNCYPSLGATCVEMRPDGCDPLTLETRGVESLELDVREGTVQFVARRIFPAESTGALFDTGGWIRLEQDPPVSS